MFSKIGNVESLVQNEGIKPTLFTICWIPWTWEPFSRNGHVKGTFLGACACLHPRQASGMLP